MFVKKRSFSEGFRGGGRIVLSNLKNYFLYTLNWYTDGVGCALNRGV